MMNGVLEPRASNRELPYRLADKVSSRHTSFQHVRNVPCSSAAEDTANVETVRLSSPSGFIVCPQQQCANGTEELLIEEPAKTPPQNVVERAGPKLPKMKCDAEYLPQSVLVNDSLALTGSSSNSSRADIITSSVHSTLGTIRGGCGTKDRSSQRSSLELQLEEAIKDAERLGKINKRQTETIRQQKTQADALKNNICELRDKNEILTTQLAVLRKELSRLHEKKEIDSYAYQMFQNRQLDEVRMLRQRAQDLLQENEIIKEHGRAMEAANIEVSAEVSRLKRTISVMRRKIMNLSSKHHQRSDGIAFNLGSMPPHCPLALKGVESSPIRSPESAFRESPSRGNTSYTTGSPKIRNL